MHLCSAKREEFVCGARCQFQKRNWPRLLGDKFVQLLELLQQNDGILDRCPNWGFGGYYNGIFDKLLFAGEKVNVNSQLKDGMAALDSVT